MSGAVLKISYHVIVLTLKAHQLVIIANIYSISEVFMLKRNANIMKCKLLRT